MTSYIFRSLAQANNPIDLGNGNIDSFGPTGTTSFDFTPLFEDTILSMAPSILLLLALPFRILSLRSQRRKVARGGFLYHSKLFFMVVFAAFNLALLVLHARLPSERTPVTIPAAVLTFVCAMGLIVLSHLEHIRSLRPSAVTNIYFLFTLIFDLARLRTLFTSNASPFVAGCFASMTALKAIVLVAEATEKRRLVLDRYCNLSPEETSGIYSRSFFIWLNPLMITGFRRFLNDKDLYPIDREMSSVILRQKIEKAWKNASKGTSRALFWAVLRSNFKPLILCIVPRLFQISFRYAQPFLLTRMISFANDLSQSDNIGWGLTGAFFFVLLGLAVSNGWYYHMTYRFVTSTRGSLISVIYMKTVNLSITAIDESVAVTLMSSDAQTICNGFETIHEFWAVPLELGVALYLLFRQLGVAFAAPTFIAFISAAGIFAIANIMGQAQRNWMKSIQSRVDMTATMLDAIKSIKILGLTDLISKMIQDLRITELRVASIFRRLLVLRVFWGNLLINLGPFATFTFYSIVMTSRDKIIDAEAAYTILTLISLLSWPVNDLISAVPMMNAALASLSRIQAFLESDARKDNRHHLNEAHTPSTANCASSIEEKEAANFKDAILVRNVSLSWTHDEKLVVRDINFTVSRGQFCFVIGPVGCGKSTLLKGILGETLSAKGFLYTNFEECAYVDQTPWIRNATVQENILGISEYDEDWYLEVVKACALEDLMLLPQGHRTIVSTSGLSLSGGQKQRLALARAVYARREVLLLDDIFSGLDADTEERIFTRLFSEQGLFRKLKSTIMLITNAIHRLSDADHVIAMTANGSIAEQGTPSQLQASRGYVNMLQEHYVLGPKTIEPKGKRIENFASTRTVDTDKDVLGNLEENVERRIAREDLTRQSGDLSLYTYYLGSVHRASTALWATGLILYGLSMQLSQIVVNFWTKAADKSGNSVNALYLGIYAMLTTISITGEIGGAYHYIMYFSPRSAKVLHERLLTAVMNAPLSFFTSVDQGTTTNRFSQDMTLIDNDLPYAMIDFILALSTGIMSAALMCISARYFAATMPPVFILMWILQKFYLRTSRQMRFLDLEAKSPLFSQFLESLSGLMTIRAFGWSSRFEEQNLALLDASQQPFYLLFCIQRWLELALDLVVTGLGVILMVVIVKMRNELSAGSVGLAVLNVITFSQSLSHIIRNWTNLETSIGAIARIRDFVAVTENENRPEETLPLPYIDNGNLSLQWPYKGAIEFLDVSASYSRNIRDKKLVIRNLSLSIGAGEKIGICGRSGSGKSSLLATLLRILEIETESRIIIDGVDITRVPREKLRAALNALPQEPFLIPGSVRKNADPLGIHASDRIIDALKDVKLWDYVQEKGGLDMIMENNFFSHGQRQLFSVARAILRGGKIILLDEVTSNIDAVSDAVIQRLIREKFKDCTILVVAHRLDTIMDFDRVALMQDGALIELDSPQTLLSKDSAFRELYESRNKDN